VGVNIIANQTMMKLKPVHHSLMSLIILLSVISCDTNKEIKRPADPWVFRSVLDRKPRMVTAALHDNLYVSYDARNCQLYKAWKGGVVFDGAVYTTKHGPQPTSKGYAYYQLQEDPKFFWYFVQNGKESEALPHFKGYYFKDGHVTFRFALEDENKQLTIVEETPEYATKDDKTGLQRTFTVTNLPSGVDIKIKTLITNMQEESDYESDGDLKVIKKEKQEMKSGSVYNAETELVLNRNSSTQFTIFYHPGFDLKGEPKEEAPKDVLKQGAALIDGSDCRTCHNETVKTVGPAYVDIAKKYDFTEGNVKMLVTKVMKGGAGNWGQVPMTAHPDLTEEVGTKMVNYIMSLDGEEQKKPEGESTPDFSIGTRYISFPLDEKNEFEKKVEGTEYPGLAVSIFKIENRDINFYELPNVADPVYTAEAPGLHFTDEAFKDKPEVAQNVLMHIKGFLNIDKEENYVIRLVSDDGSKMWLDSKLIIDNDGMHGPEAKDAEMLLKKGKHAIEIIYYQGGGGGALSLQWAKHGEAKFKVIPSNLLSHNKRLYKKSFPYVSLSKLIRNVPGDKRDEAGVHPSFEVSQARPSSFEPKVGGLDFLSDSSLLVCTWDSVGPLYRLEGVTRNNPEAIKVTRIASGLAEPLGVKVVNDTIYVLQKQELTRLLDNDKDGIIDEYQTVCDGWKVSANFHEFAFGLAYKDGYFYAALATAINPGGASTNPQIPDRGKAIKISKKDGSFEFIASGLRTPNGINFGVDDQLFIADNQGDWLPASKILHITNGSWYGSRSVDFEGTATLREKPPVVWLPQDEIGNSPSQPIAIDLGPYKGQQLHGEVTHGGLKRVFMEKVNGEYQGAVFRFTQGLEGGVNRVVWGPDNALYVGMIGNPGNWNTTGGKWFGLQKLKWTGKPAFEMLAVRAKSNGMEIEMTEPISEDYGNSVADYEVKQWYYKPTADYGGPKLDEKFLKIRSVNISADRKKIFLELDGLEPNHVVYIRLKGIFISTENRNLWATESWYTLNQIPSNSPGFSNPSKEPVANTLTEKEQQSGWKLLFDGRTTAGWRKYRGEKAGKAWKVKDGALYLDTSNKKDWQTGDGGDIITAEEFENYELSLEWKIQKCGNSGIIFNVVESDKNEYVWNTGPEMQVLDNICHPDGRIEKHRVGNLYDLIDSKYVAANPPGEWNRARIIANHGKYELWLNGYQIVEVDMTSQAWRDLIRGSKFKDMPDFGKSTKGHIALQDHGDAVWFRNIKIKELK
jgi:cytochrome c